MTTDASCKVPHNPPVWALNMEAKLPPYAELTNFPRVKGKVGDLLLGRCSVWYVE